MDSLNQAISNLTQLIPENTSVGVVASGHQDLDVLAAALSLHLIFQDSGKSSQAVSLKEPTVEHSFLVGIDQLSKNFSGATKTLTVSFPYLDGDIEKVSYNIEGDRLNVNLFAEEQGIRFSEKDIKYIRQGASPQLIFTVGVSQISEIQGLVDSGAKIVNIDNSAGNGMFGQINIVDPGASSLSEIVAKIARELSLQVEFDVAQNLLDGITAATVNFSSPKTSSLAFEMAGFLLQKGAVRKDLKSMRPQTADTSLQMLGKKSFGGPQDKQPFSAPQDQPLSNGQNITQPSPFNQPSSQPRTDPRFDALVSDPFAVSSQPSGQNRPMQPQPIPRPQANDADVMDTMPNLPSEDEAPSDWFTPKVFKSNKPQ